MVKVPPITDTTAFKLLEPVVTVAFGASLLRTFGVQWTRGLIYSTSLRYIAGRLILSRQPVKAPPPAPITRSKADEQLITRLEQEKEVLEKRATKAEGKLEAEQEKTQRLEQEKEVLEKRVTEAEGKLEAEREKSRKLETEKVRLEQERDLWKKQAEELKKANQLLAREKEEEKQKSTQLSTENEELRRQLEQLRLQFEAQKQAQAKAEKRRASATLTTSETDQLSQKSLSVENPLLPKGVPQTNQEKENRLPGDGANAVEEMV